MHTRHVERLRLLVAAAVAIACSPASPDVAKVTPRPAGPAGAPGPVASPSGSAEPLSLLAFGSCLDQRLPMPILAAIEAKAPELLIMLGDNVYADATRVEDLERAYATLAADRGWQSLRKRVPMLAVWDDHDYGLNDSGKENALKGAAKTAMLDFFGEPAQSPRRARAGAYDARVYGPPGQRVQVILLDTRWFRDGLVPGSAGRKYRPHPDAQATILGAAQWTWLEAQLRAPAELRLLVSGVQVIPAEHGWESWGLFPAERDRLFALLGETDATGVILLSGDRHRAELSCAWHPAVGYPVFEVTSSSLNRPIDRHEENRFRLPKTPLLMDVNFGVIAVDWRGDDTGVEVAIVGERGETRIARNIELRQLRRAARRDGGVACPAF